MGSAAYRQLGRYREVVDDCAAAFTAAGCASPLAYLTGETGSDFTEIEIEGAQFTHAVALARLWQDHGVFPDLTVGHSLGEVAAGHIAGSLSLTDAVSVIRARAGVVNHLDGYYAVAALGITPQDAQQLIDATDGWVELSVINATSSVAVSGDRDAVRAVIDTVRSQGRFAREITVGFPVHTSILEPLRDRLRRQLPDTAFTDSAVRFIGSTFGDTVTAGTGFADYWYANLRHTVRFDQAVSAALAHGGRSFIEISPHPGLLHAMTDLLDDSCALIGSGRRDIPLPEELSRHIAATTVADPVVRWAVPAGCPTTPLPGFPPAPMRATALWAHPEPLPAEPVLTVQTERWRQVPEPEGTSAPTRVAVMDLGVHMATADADAAGLADRLRAEIVARPDTELVPVSAADTVAVIAPVISTSDAPTAAAQLAACIEAGLTGYRIQCEKDSRTVCLVTVGAEQVRPGELPLPGTAAVAALHRCIGLEHPEQTYTQLDLDHRAFGDAGLVRAAAHVLSTHQPVGALRVIDGEPRWWQREQAASAPSNPLPAAAFDDVVITGGSGAIAMHYARYLASRGARRITLLSRSAISAAAVNHLRAHGSEVITARCDITDTQMLTAAAAASGTHGATLVIHTAANAVFASADDLTGADIAHTCAAKVTGLARLIEYWPLRPDTRILLCSSLSGLWGGRGHGSYAAANRMLDVMAAQLRAAGRECTAIRWGLWQTPEDAGIVTAAETATIERAGLMAMEPDRAVPLSLSAFDDDPLIYRGAHDRLQLITAATGIIAPPAPEISAAQDTTEAVRSQLAAVLSLDTANLDLDAELFDLGIDSLLAVDLRKRLRHTIGHTVPLAALLGGITGADLVRALDTAARAPEKVGHPT